MKFDLQVNFTYSDLQSTIEEQKYSFIIEILNAINLPLNDCFPDSGNYSDLSLEHKIKLRQILGKNNISIIDDRLGGIKIYLNSNTLIAEWKKPLFEIKENLSDRKLYYILHIDYWSEYEK